MTEKFCIGFSADFFDADGKPQFEDYGVSVFESYPAIEVLRFGEHRPEITPDQLDEVQGVITLTPRVTCATLSRSENLLAISRFGVGYDMIDVAACTAADVLLTIARGSVDRSVAEACVGWMIALSHHMPAKDRLLREGRWAERSRYMGTELRDRTLGVIGFGGIGRALVEILRGFKMNPPLVFDPYVDRATIDSYGARKVELERLLEQADFVSVNCPLTEETRNLIGARQLGLMKRTAYLLNTARGGIVNEEALFETLSERRIAGAALDCFEVEPVPAGHRFAELDNVLLAPHSIAWTYELFRDIGRMTCQSMLDLAYGRRPHGIVNAEVLERPGFQRKWERLRLPSPDPEIESGMPCTLSSR